MRHFVVGLIFLTSSAFAEASWDHSSLQAQGGTVGGWGLKLQGGSVGGGGGGGALSGQGSGIGGGLGIDGIASDDADFLTDLFYLLGIGGGGGSPPATNLNGGISGTGGSPTAN